MRIVVNTRLLIAEKLSGIGWFAYHTLKRIVEWHPEHEFIFLFDRKYDEQFIFGSNVIPEVVFPPARHPVLWYLWFEHAIVRRVRKHKPSLFYSPEGYLSLKLKEIPSLPVIHDINFHRDKYGVPLLDGVFWRFYFPKYAAMASRIITVSEFSKNEIGSYYNIPFHKIDIAYNGADSSFVPLGKEDKDMVKQKYTQGEEYFLYVGVLVPRKNIVRMIEAYEKFRKSSGKPVKLVIVGDRLFFTPDMQRAYEKSTFKNDIIFTGRLDQQQLSLIMGAALSLILVSCYEGFGIPVIEAMYAEVPVITSNLSSMPEIAGDAALMADPYSVDSIKEAMLRISSDAMLREELILKGRIRRQKFTWDNCAKSIWESIEKVLSVSSTES
jgi:glycosyltransferase involved in cell wall biosynthesis